jgi:glycosyltransferase involved in cell wall biosynthesis
VNRPLRAAFVMEQTLGHVTHGRNLSQVLAGQDAVEATWLPVPFDVRGAGRLLPLWRSNWSLRASWRARMALEAALRARRHDALFFHTQVVSLFSTAYMRRLPAVISLDATPINMDSVGAFYNHRPAGDGVLDRQKYRLNRAAFHSAAALVSWSQWGRRSLVEDYGVDDARVRVIAPGAAPDYFRIGRRRLSAEPPQDGGRPVRILFVGGDFRRKGGPLLLEALKGPLGARCEAHIVTREAVAPQANVTVYHGLGPNSPQLLELFAAADVFVLPSLGECLAVVLMEATAAGLPVITTDVGALGEAVLPAESGLLVPPGDGAALAHALRTLVEDGALRRRMGRAGLALAEARFHAERNNRTLLDLLAEVAGARDEERWAA